MREIINSILATADMNSVKSIMDESPYAVHMSNSRESSKAEVMFSAAVNEFYANRYRDHEYAAIEDARLAYEIAAYSRRVHEVALKENMALRFAKNMIYSESLKKLLKDSIEIDIDGNFYVNVSGEKYIFLANHGDLRTKDFCDRFFSTSNVCSAVSVIKQSTGEIMHGLISWNDVNLQFHETAEGKLQDILVDAIQGNGFKNLGGVYAYQYNYNSKKICIRLIDSVINKLPVEELCGSMISITGIKPVIQLQ